MTERLDSVTVVIPHIPSRVTELQRALASVWAQTYQPDEVVISTDIYKNGSAATRTRGMHHISTNWIAFLDDDDELLPDHLEILMKAAIRDGERPSIVYPGCRVVGPDGVELPRREEWGRFGREFDPELLRQMSYIPVTSLINVYVARRTFFGPPVDHPESNYDDWGFYLRALNAGATFLHVPEVTWIWHHHGANTSGRPDRW